jgi:hypothetical protein
MCGATVLQTYAGKTFIEVIVSLLLFIADYSMRVSAAVKYSVLSCFIFRLAFS